MNLTRLHVTPLEPGEWTEGPCEVLVMREWELPILHIGWLCQAEYEGGRHVIFARKPV